jgi:hypothetical protein
MMLLRLSLVMLPAVAGSACVVQSTCYNDADCPGGKYCNTAQGRCMPYCQADSDCQTDQFCGDDHTCQDADCFRDEDCDPGYKCEDHVCRAGGTLVCPDGMLAIENRFCIDIYEASRPDATEISSGTSNAMATSRLGVLPWMVENNAEALAACQAAGKTLCTEKQWGDACPGPEGTVYGYGDEYDPEICNGIDKYCYCNGAQCADEDPCPFPHCYHTCGASFRRDPTGSNPGCTNGYGLFDMNGNVWEHVLGGDETRIRGGAYNCSDSETLHRCDYIPGTWRPSARGFRCCSPGTVIEE